MSAGTKGPHAFSGRAIGKGLRKRRGGGNTSSEHRGLRSRRQPQPSGKARWANGHKYFYQNGLPCPGI